MIRSQSNTLRQRLFRFLPHWLILCAIALAMPQGFAQPDQGGNGRARFVPADQLADVFERNSSGVFLPRNEYLELVAKARQAQQRASEVPNPLVIRSANYRVSPDDNHALVEMQLEAEQFLDGWALLEVPIGNLNLESATIDEADAPVGPVQGSDRISIAHEGVGPFTVTLTLSTPLGTVGSDRVAAFRTAGDIATTLEVECPQERIVQFNDLHVDRPAPISEPAVYGIPAGSFDQIRIKWTTEQQQTDTQSLVFAATNVRLQLSSDNLRWTSESRISVFGIAINEIVASVPQQLEITAVESAGLEAWKLEDDPDLAGATRLVLAYRQPFTKDRLIKVQAVATAVSEDKWKVPTLQFRELTSHTGRILVQHEQKLRLMAETRQGVRQISLNEQTAGEAFDFWLQDFDLRLAVRPRDRELFAEVNSSLVFQDSDVSLTAETTIETLNAPLFELPVRIPAGWQVQQLTANNNPIPTWRRTEDPEVIVIEPASPIPAGGLLNFQLQLGNTIDDPTDEQVIDVPVVSAEDALLVGGTYSIAGATDLTVSPLEINGLSPIADENGQTLFETQGTTYSGRVSVVRKPARLSSRAVFRTWLDARQKSVELLLTVDVLNGTTRTLELELPEELGDDIRFSLQSISQVPGHSEQQVPGQLSIIEQTAGQVADGSRAFQLTFDRRFVGAVTLQAYVQQPREENTRLSAPFMRVKGAVRQHGLIAFEAQADQQIDVPENMAESGLSIADAGLVSSPPLSTGRRVALVYRFVQPEYELQLSETTFATETVPSAVVRLIENTSVVSESELQQRQSRIFFRASGVQTLRFSLPQPDDSYLWSTVLNGEPIEVRKDDSDYLVAVPLNSAVKDHVLEVLFETPNQSSSISGSTEQGSVSLKIDAEDGLVTDVDVLEQQWDVRYPDSAMLLNYGTGFRPLRALDRAGWLQIIPTLISLPTQQSLWQRGGPVAILLLVFFVATSLVLKKRWKTLVCVSAIAFFLLLTPLMQNSREAARKIAGYTTADTAAEIQAVPNAAEGDFSIRSRREIMEYEEYSSEESGAMMEMNGDQGIDAFADDKDGQQGGQSGQQGGAAGQREGRDRQSQPGAVAGEIAPALSPQINSPIVLTDDPFAEAESKPKSGSARLSVKAKIATPTTFQSMKFRSIGATNEAGTLNITIQPRARVAALRIMAALIIALVCLTLNTAALVRKIVFALIVSFAAIAAVPIVPNQWQCLVDGALLGTAAGITIWLAFGFCRFATNCCRHIAQKQRVTLSASAKTILVGLSLLGGDQLYAQSETPPRPTQDIVLPYNPDGPQLLADKVFLPQEQFLELYKAANPDRLQPNRLPINEQVIAAYYVSGKLDQAQDENWVQQFKARFVVQIATKSKPKVRLPIGSVAIRSAIIDGQPIAITPIRPEPDQQQDQPQSQKSQVLQQQRQSPSNVKHPPKTALEVLIANPGLHVLDVEFDVAARIEGDVGNLTLPFTPVPMGTMIFTLPNDDLEATVNGRTNVFRREGRALTLPVSRSSVTSIAWRPAARKNAGDTTFHSQADSALSISDQGLALESAIRINCRHGELQEVDINVSADYTIQQVRGTEIAGWEIRDEETGALRVLFKEPVTKETTIHLVLFRRQVIEREESKVRIPVPEVVGATRDTGTVSLCAGGELEVRVDSLSAVSQINAADAVLPEGMRQSLPRVLAWRYTRHPVSIGVRVFRDADKLTVTSLSGVQLEPQRQLWTTLISANISGSPRRRIEIAVPKDFLALDVTANGLADWYYSESEADDVRLLNVQLQQARSGVVNVVIQGQTARAQNEEQVSLSAPRVATATESKSTVSVWLDAASEIASVESAEWKRVGRDSRLDPRILKLQPDAPDISFQANSNVESEVLLALRQAESSLSAESVTITTVTDTAVELTLGLNWKISGAATRTVAFAVPTSLTDVYDFQVPGLRRLQEIPNGDSTTVVIHLQQPVSESLFVLGTGTMPLPDSRTMIPQQPTFVVPDGSSDRVTTQSHFWVIVNQSPGLLQPVSQENDGDEVQPDEIRTNMPTELLEQAVAIRRLKPTDEQSPWQLSFPERQKVAPAIVALAAHTTVIAEDGTWRSRHRLQVRNESRQFLTIELPDDSRALYCRVENRPVRMVSRNEGESVLHLIPIPQTGEVSRPIEVEFAIAGTTALRQPATAGSTVEIPCPTVPAFREHPDYGVTISRNTWQVYVPETWHTTIRNDPRDTNVVRASEEVLEDAILLSGVENLKSILNAASSQSQVDNVSLVNEIERQRIVLRSLACNDIAVGQQRDEILSQANVLFEQLNRDNKEQLDAFQAWQGQGNGVNPFLDQQALELNGYNQRNTANLIFGNAAKGVQLDDDGQILFNFNLPADAEPKSESRSGREFGGKVLEKQKQNRPQFAPQEAPAVSNSSQLLNRRDVNRKSQSEKLRSLNAIPEQLAQERQLNLQNSLPGFANQFGFPESGNKGNNEFRNFGTIRDNTPAQQQLDGAMGGMGFGATPNLSLGIQNSTSSSQFAPEGIPVPITVQSQGKLSLEFDIPEDGLRYDFVRAGGNASLSLNVRQQDQVSLLKGLLWAVVCLILLTVVLRASGRGLFSLAIRACAILAAIGLAGWMCTQNPLQQIAVGLFLLGSIATCILVVVQARRMSSIVADA